MDRDTTDLLEKLLGRLATGSDARAGCAAILRGIEERYPGEIARMSACLTLQALGVMQAR